MKKKSPDKAGCSKTSNQGAGLPPAYFANNEALGGLDKLDTLAKMGNADAIRMFHSITCGMVQRLNELHLDYSASVLEWPVLLPQDRKARSVVTRQANAMRIGSVRGGGEGAGRGSKDLLDYTSQKGFSIQNLRRVNFARKYLAPIAPAYDYGETKEDYVEIPSQIEDTIKHPTDFAEATEITNFGEQLLLEISGLPDYSPDKREDWIRVIVAVLRRNPHLVVEKFKDSKRKVENYSIKNRQGDEVEFNDVSWQGGILAMTLRAGLETVSYVPGVWGE